MSTVFHNILRAADKRYARRFAVLGAVFLAVLLGSLLVGRYALSPGQRVHMLWTRITGGAADWPISDDKVVFAVRLPRVAAAALAGAALAVSGAAYQGMFRNPMVSPDILGASSGYRVADPEGMASHGGFKDWFISAFGRPGFTIEFGLGENPLPLEDFEPIYRKTREMLLLAALM